MSSRSNGVMNEEFTLRMIAWVVSSAACSTSRIAAAIGSRSDCGTPRSFGQLLRPVDQVARRRREQVVEAGVLRSEAKTHGKTPVIEEVAVR